MVLIVYHHIGYPLLLRGLTRWTRAADRSLKNSGYLTSLTGNIADFSKIAIVIPAFNEQKYIAAKVHNLAILDYPGQCLRIIIACDGCTDNTAAIARITAQQLCCRHLKLEVIEFSKNRGKVAVINEIMANVDEELVALSDVSALLSIDALTQVNQYFSDKTIGLLTGHYLLANPGSPAEASYWQYQGDLKAREGRLGAVIGAHGAFYVIRRRLFRPLPEDAINDDFIIPMSIVEQGFRAIYVSAIKLIELEQATDNMDRRRRSRIAAGNLQQLIRFKGLLAPKYKGVAFAFASGKALRVLMPLLLIVAWAGSLILAGSGLFFLLVAILQTLIYVAVLMFQLIKPRRPNKIWQAIYYVVSGYVANLIGYINYILGRDCRH